MYVVASSSRAYIDAVINFNSMFWHNYSVSITIITVLRTNGMYVELYSNLLLVFCFLCVFVGLLLGRCTGFSFFCRFNFFVMLLLSLCGD